jgi:hypothetical protein
MNQRKKGYQPTSFQNVAKSFPRKYFQSDNQNTQGGGKPVNLGTNKFGDIPKEPFKCWECGEPRLRRNCPRLTSVARTTGHKLLEAFIVGDVGKSLHKINAVMDGQQVDHQSTIVEVEGKINNNHVSVLIDPWDTLSYVSPSVVDSNKLKKIRHEKSWLVQLETRTKRKVSEFIYDCEFSLGGQNTNINLNILPLGSYDIIFGMDWLERHKEVLDCYEKSLNYQDENDIVRTIQGIWKSVSVRKISAMQFKKCMRKGCHIYAIQVTNLLEKENKTILEYFVVLHDFRDVFVEEIHELPPRREIDFSIDLLSCLTLISKAPYKMSLPKLT